MTLVMAYVILIAATLSACAVVLESVARTRGRAGRWIWVSALGLTAVATVLAMVMPRPDGAVASLLLEVPVAAATEGIALPSQSPVVAWETLFKTGDALLPVAWLLATISLLIAIGVGQRRLRRERARSRAADLAGHRVLLTEATGPAVAGIREPVVFIPRWVLALDEPSQQLLLTHEMEHVKRRDTAVLFTGAVAVAVLPWNPVVWWMVRRLRLAVEQDCDARVLARHPGVRRYADLLLMAASRHGLASRLLAAHFGEHTSDLMRRIEAMTSSESFPWRRIVGATLVASALIVAACETPRPEPVAPINRAEAAVTGPQEAPAILKEFQVEKPVSLVQGTRMPKYPEILRQAGVEGEVLVSFVVDESGAADESSLKVIRSTHELFSTAVRQAIPEMRFTAAEVGGRKMKQFVQHPFTFTLEGMKRAAGVESEREVTTSANFVTGELPEKKLAYTLHRGELTPLPLPNVVVLSMEGKELARSEGDDRLLRKIAPESIHSIEVFKPTTCPAAMTCPLIKITLAKGRTLQR